MAYRILLVLFLVGCSSDVVNNDESPANSADLDAGNNIPSDGAIIGDGPSGGDGGGSDASSTSLEGLPIEEVARRLAETQCEALERCLSDWRWSAAYDSQDDCVEAQLETAWWEHDDIETDAAPYEECLSAWETLVCDEWTSIPECRIPGMRGQGEPCVSNLQCRTGLCTSEDWNETCRTCRVPPKAGDECLRIESDVTVDNSSSQILSPTCFDGLVCHRQMCAIPAGLGEDCADAPCRFGLSCRTTDQTCVPGGDVGDRCGPNADVLECDRSRGIVCRANECVQLEAVDVGEACDGQETVCRGGALCDRDQNLCVPRPTVGERCEGFDCDTGLVCVGTGSCEPLSCPD